MKENKEYYLSILEKGDFLIYRSENFKLSELELLNLIKITLVNGRSKIIGNKLLRVYKDSTKDRIELSIKRLNLIGLNEENENPKKEKKPKTK